MFSPTTATVAKPDSASMLVISPTDNSLANSFRNTFTAFVASHSFTANVVLCSDDDCATKNTLIPFFANVLNILEFTPITPTIPKPETVTNEVSLIDDIPLISLVS